MTSTSVQFSCSVMSDSSWLHGLQHAWFPCPLPNSQSLLKLMSIESVMSANHLILCRPLLLPSSIFPSIRVFSNESVLCIRGPKYWSFSISPSNEYSGLISFRIDWFDHCSPRDSQEASPTRQFKASVFQHADFFIVQISFPYMTTRKTIALTRRTFVVLSCRDQEGRRVSDEVVPGTSVFSSRDFLVPLHFLP